MTNAVFAVVLNPIAFPVGKNKHLGSDLVPFPCACLALISTPPHFLSLCPAKILHLGEVMGLVPALQK